MFSNLDIDLTDIICYSNALSCFRNREHTKYVEKLLHPAKLPYVKNRDTVKQYQQHAIKAIKMMGAQVEETEDSTKQLRKYRIVY